MRSMLIATAMCAAALTFSGCSFTISGPCTTLSHQSRAQGCGCDMGDSCDTCSPRQMMNSWKGQPECAGVNFGEGAPCGMESVSMPSMPKMGGRGLFARMASKGQSDCGCDSGSCDGGCGASVAPSMDDCGCGSSACDGGCGGSTGVRGQMGMSIFDRGTDCGGGTEMVSTQGRGIRVPGSRVHGAVANHMGGGNLRGRVASAGCGKFGCGRDGKLCLGCKARGGLGLGKSGGGGFGGRPYSGEIPHTTTASIRCWRRWTRNGSTVRVSLLHNSRTT